MFTLPPDRKQRVLHLLEEAAAAIRDGRIEILEDVLTGYSSDGMGYTRHKETMFFGIEYRIVQRPAAQKQNAVQPPAAQIVPPPVAQIVQRPVAETPTQWESSAGAKMSNSMVERCKANGVYACPKGCGFTTESSTGMKKHYNRCTFKR